MVACVWSKRNAADLNWLPAVPLLPVNLWLKPVDLWGASVSSAGCSTPTNWSCPAGFWEHVGFWVNYSCEESGTDSRAGSEWLDFCSLTGLKGCIRTPNQRVSCRCAGVSEAFCCCGAYSYVFVRKFHLLAALQFAASPAGTIAQWKHIPTRCFRERGASTARTGSPSGSLDLRCYPRLLFLPLWPNKQAFAPSPPQKNAFQRGSCHVWGKVAAGPPPGPCYPGSLGCRGAAC